MPITVNAPLVGFVPTSPTNGTGTQTNNAANTWVAFSFICRHPEVNEVACYLSAITGTMTAAELTCSIQASNSSGVPNGSSVETVNCDAVPAVGINTWTLTGTYTPGTTYWAVFKNLNGTPASNFVSWRFMANGTLPVAKTGNTITGPGFHKRHSTDAGTTWTAGNVAASGGIRIKYDSNGTPFYDGFLVNTQATIGNTGGVYDTRKLGVKFTTPANGQYKVAGATMFHLRTGTPTGNLYYELYEGSTPTLVATSTVAPNASYVAISSTGYIPLHFETTVSSQLVPTSYTLSANTIYRLVMCVSTGGSTSNYLSSYRYTMESGSATEGINPFSGTVQETYYNGSTWTDTADQFLPFGLLLDSDDPITASGGGGTTYIYNMME